MKANDTLIVLKNGRNAIEKYAGQNLDEYDHIAEMNHEKLIEYKVNGYWYMNGITYDDIYNYLTEEIGYNF